jgi:hypothetical protein
MPSPTMTSFLRIWTSRVRESVERGYHCRRRTGFGDAIRIKSDPKARKPSVVEAGRKGNRVGEGNEEEAKSVDVDIYQKVEKA